MIISDITDDTKPSSEGLKYKNLLGESSMTDVIPGFGNEGGLIGGLILGSLLNGGNMFGRNGVGAVESAVASKGDVWQAEGQVQLAIAQDTISNLQSTIGLTKTVTDSAAISTLASQNAELAILAAISGAAKEAAVANALTNSVVALGNANTVAAIAESKFELAQVINDDGAKTRHLIEGINLANLNRELVVAQNALADSHAHGRHAATEVNVSQVVNQAQAQAQQQQQQIVTNQLLSTLCNEMQRNTQSTVAIGSTLTGNSQTATNNRVS